MTGPVPARPGGQPQPALSGSDLMTLAEVATQCQVDVRTVTRWAWAGKLTCSRTPGGHRRYSRTEVEALLGAPSEDDLMTPAEVGALFRVNPKRVGEWAKAGKIRFITLPSGHRRYRRSEVEALAVRCGMTLAGAGEDVRAAVRGGVPRLAGGRGGR